MAKAKYLRIPPDAWKRYQQRERKGDGWKPPWFKMWSKLIDSYEVRSLKPDERYVYVGILCLANETNNRVIADACWLGNRLMLPSSLADRAVNQMLANGLVERCSARDFEISSNEVESPKKEVEERSRENGKPFAASPPVVEVEQPKKAREPDVIWDALIRLFGEPATKNERSRRNGVVKQLREAGATPEQIRAAPAAWRENYPDATFTENALVNHWSFLQQKVAFRNPVARMAEAARLREAGLA